MAAMRLASASAVMVSVRGEGDVPLNRRTRTLPRPATWHIAAGAETRPGLSWAANVISTCGPATRT